MCVCALVYGQVAALREARPANFAFIRPFFRMDAFVRDQGALMSEARSTVLAAIRFLEGVRAIVHGQVG